MFAITPRRQLDGSSSSASSPTTPAEMTALTTLQRLLMTLLRVHGLSPAIRYEPHEPLRVDADAWWRELLEQSAAALGSGRSTRRPHPRSRSRRRQRPPPPTTLTTTSANLDAIAPDRRRHRAIYRESFVRLVQSLTRLLEERGRRQQRPMGGDMPGALAQAELRCVLGDTERAIAVVGARLLSAWSASDDPEDDETDDDASAGDGNDRENSNTSDPHAENDHQDRDEEDDEEEDDDDDDDDADADAGDRISPRPPAGVELARLLVQCLPDVGAFHAFHAHKLHVGVAARVFRGKKLWQCSQCERSWEVASPSVRMTAPAGAPATGPPLVFRCPPCAFTLCRECYTRVPNHSAQGHPCLAAMARVQARFQPPGRLGPGAAGLLPLVLPVLRAEDPRAFAAVASRAAIALRQHLHDLPVHRATEFVPLAQSLVGLLEVPGVARALVDGPGPHEDASRHHAGDPNWAWMPWSPIYISGAKLRLQSFLGPLFWATSMTPDEDPMAPASSCLAAWVDGYRILRPLLRELVQTLLDATRTDARVVDATLTWLAVVVGVCFFRRRPPVNHHEPTHVEDHYDGLLINLSAAVLGPVLEILDARPECLDATYHDHGSLPRRVYYVREEPLQRPTPEVLERAREREHARLWSQDQVHLALGRELWAPHDDDDDDVPNVRNPTDETTFYPTVDRHMGVLCDNCHSGDFPIARYKCVHCDDADICANCYAQFVRESEAHATATAQGDDRPRDPGIHDPEHVFLRIDIPVPLIVIRHFEPLPTGPATLAYGVDDNASCPTPHHCGDCGRDVTDDEIVFRCANCFTPRLRCQTCLDGEESQSSSPYDRHAPGHLYFGLSRAWRRRFDSLAPGLHSTALFFPAPLCPRERFNLETELFFLTIRAIHVGPLLSLSKFLTQVKEMHELEAFCACEEQRVAYERQSQDTDGGSRGSRQIKHSPHYAASQVRLVDLRATRYRAELHLVNVANVVDWLRFYAKTCRWLLRLASTTENAFAVIVSEFSEAFGAFPEHFFVDVCDMVYLLSLECIDYQAASALFMVAGDNQEDIAEPLLVMLVQLMASRQCTKNPHLRVQAGKSLTALLSFFSKSKGNAVLRNVFRRCEVLRWSMVRAVLQFHEDMEAYHVRNNGLVFSNNAGSGDHLLWGFLSIRVTTVLLLRTLWQIPEQRQRIGEAFAATTRSAPPNGGNAAGTTETPVPATDPTHRAANQVSRLITGLWSDASKLFEEGNGKIAVLQQLTEIQEAIRDGVQVSLPFRPSMLEGYIALHSKHLRLAMRLLIEVLELLSWMADNHALKRALLRSELVDQSAQTTSFLVSNVAVAIESNSWLFSWHLPEDGNLLIAHLTMFIVRCAGDAQMCTPSCFWKLIKKSGASTLRYVGDMEVHARWALNSAITQLESARHLGDIVDDPDNEGDLIGGASVSAEYTSSTPAIDDNIDENDALALLEERSAACQSVHRLSVRQQGQTAAAAKRWGRRFLAALANDGRFDLAKFAACAQQLQNDMDGSASTPAESLLDGSWLECYSHLMDRCKEMIRLQATMDELLVDIPEEYLDPLLNTIMTDPVRLPSGNVVDRSVIERHLISSQRVDPFTREPLTVDPLAPCDALRQEIQLYLRSKLRHLDHTRDDVLATWGEGWDSIFEVGSVESKKNGDGSQ